MFPKGDTSKTPGGVCDGGSSKNVHRIRKEKTECVESLCYSWVQYQALAFVQTAFLSCKKKKKKDWYSRAQSSSISTGKLKKNKKYCSWISKETLDGILGMSDNGADLEVQHSHSSWPRAETEVHVELAV